MRTFRYNKLVRDKVVEDIKQEGGVPDYRVLKQDEYVAELKRKLQEETTELVGTTKQDLLGELADIQEIVYALIDALAITPQELMDARDVKNLSKGPFKERYYINTADVHETSKWINYFLKNADRYPEVKK